MHGRTSPSLSSSSLSSLPSRIRSLITQLAAWRAVLSASRYLVRAASSLLLKVTRSCTESSHRPPSRNVLARSLLRWCNWCASLSVVVVVVVIRGTVDGYFHCGEWRESDRRSLLSNSSSLFENKIQIQIFLVAIDSVCGRKKKRDAMRCDTIRCATELKNSSS